MMDLMKSKGCVSWLTGRPAHHIRGKRGDLKLDDDRAISDEDDLDEKVEHKRINPSREISENLSPEELFIKHPDYGPDSAHFYRTREIPRTTYKLPDDVGNVLQHGMIRKDAKVRHKTTTIPGAGLVRSRTAVIKVKHKNRKQNENKESDGKSKMDESPNEGRSITTRLQRNGKKMHMYPREPKKISSIANTGRKGCVDGLTRSRSSVRFRDHTAWHVQQDNNRSQAQVGSQKKSHDSEHPNVDRIRVLKHSNESPQYISLSRQDHVEIKSTPMDDIFVPIVDEDKSNSQERAEGMSFPDLFPYSDKIYHFGQPGVNSFNPSGFDGKQPKHHHFNPFNSEDLVTEKPQPFSDTTLSSSRYTDYMSPSVGLEVPSKKANEGKLENSTLTDSQSLAGNTSFLSGQIQQSSDETNSRNTDSYTQESSFAYTRETYFQVCGRDIECSPCPSMLWQYSEDSRTTFNSTRSGEMDQTRSTSTKRMVNSFGNKKVIEEGLSMLGDDLEKDERGPQESIEVSRLSPGENSKGGEAKKKVLVVSQQTSFNDGGDIFGSDHQLVFHRPNSSQTSSISEL